MNAEKEGKVKLEEVIKEGEERSSRRGKEIKERDRGAALDWGWIELEDPLDL